MKSFSFTYTQNESLPESQPLRVYVVDKETGEELSQSAAVSLQPTVDWVSVAPTAGNTVIHANVHLTDAAKILGVGTYNGLVRVETSTPEIENSPQIAPVSLEIVAAVEQNIRLSTTFMKFLFLKPGNLPPQQSFVVSAETSAARFTTPRRPINVELYSSVDWLSVTPAYGNTPLTANVKLKNEAKKLSPGMYSAQIEVRSVEAVNSPEVVTINFEVVNK